jgi:hypothetical protein
MSDEKTFDGMLAPFLAEFNYVAIMDNLPKELRHIKHDFPDHDTVRLRRIWRDIARREAQFIAYDCT